MGTILPIVDDYWIAKQQEMRTTTNFAIIEGQLPTVERYMKDMYQVNATIFS